jgi:hypothetical protein
MTLEEDLGPEWSLLHASFERVRLSAAPLGTDHHLRHGWKPCPFKAGPFRSAF